MMIYKLSRQFTCLILLFVFSDVPKAVTNPINVARSNSFQGKTVLVTGASHGIGAVTAIQFAKNGAQVVICGRNQTNLASVSRLCLAASPQRLKPLELVLDLDLPEHCRQVINATITTFGKLDILVNNGGTGMPTNIFMPDILERFNKVIATSLRSMVYLTHIAVPHLVKTGGNVVIISSVSSAKPNSQFHSFGMRKAAIETLTKILAGELQPKGVRVNAIHPAPVKSTAQEAPDGDVSKLAEPADIAKTVLYLASPEAKLMTGVNLLIDSIANIPFGN